MAPSKACLAMTDMWAMELGAVGGPLRLVARALPDPGQGELLVKVTACGVCRTDLHIFDGEVAAQLPIIPGHEIVGIVAALGAGVTGLRPGDWGGVPWPGGSSRRLGGPALAEQGHVALRGKVNACGVCRTDLHICEGEVAAQLPIIPGHEIVGIVAALGEGVTGFRPGDRVGVPWWGHSCGRCDYCRSGRENLCDTPGFTGCTRDGGYATHAVADAHFCFHIPASYADEEAAPLLCADRKNVV